MREIELSGVIEYEDTGGDGPAVVLLHGVVIGPTVWRHVVEDLRSDYRCIVPALPLGAHRQARKPDADLTIYGVCSKRLGVPYTLMGRKRRADQSARRSSPSKAAPNAAPRRRGGVIRAPGMLAILTSLLVVVGASPSLARLRPRRLRSARNSSPTNSAPTRRSTSVSTSRPPLVRCLRRSSLLVSVSQPRCRHLEHARARDLHASGRYSNTAFAVLPGVAHGTRKRPRKAYRSVPGFCMTSQYDRPHGAVD